ncbi:MAG: hypoxanthine phosphoribosyltransferase [Tenuifilum sp.]|uniref:Hypoxanthine phosphoribosyltransferase n=1 Tax=Tenuifilum thalassicum TaxID=2590900 RepID=A0A7D4BCU7_9BACT|nr:MULTISPECIES: hypoxanthine phosphoribosyltransferase [Tenuifilum]MDI3525898.1 hypoxanthine phosphoribosyltransferase [Tenuifilum sp.]QKG78858.1 hypoxanthine phosphoribosyltransferase [Tenuifilum thalassicum]
MKQVKLKDKEFRLSYPESEIQADIEAVAKKINNDFASSKEIPLFISVLNGSFMFTADLLKRITIDCEVSFIRLASYQGTSSTGVVNEILGLSENVKNRTLIVVEDIVDTGVTLSKLYKELNKLNPKEIRVATLLFKPEAYKGDIKIDYIGRSIPNDFIVGYGLDYDGLGRNLPDIYTVI